MFPRRLEYPRAASPAERKGEGERISGGHLAFGPGDGDDDPTDLSPMVRPFRRRGAVHPSRAGGIFLVPAAFRRAQGPFGPASLPWPRSCPPCTPSRAATSVLLQAGDRGSDSLLGSASLQSAEPSGSDFSAV